MGIFTHACLGTNDIERARIFYDAALAPLGVICLGNFLDQGLSYGRTVPELLILQPLDSRLALAGNGVTLRFTAFDHAAVDAFHQEGLRSDEHTSELQSLMRISYAVFCLHHPIPIKHTPT